MHKGSEVRELVLVKGPCLRKSSLSLTPSYCGSYQYYDGIDLMSLVVIFYRGIMMRQYHLCLHLCP